ncbi:hypothetical protein AACH06_15580 [Ideonella sp. DXS29W]|uniref:Uncharacterized protein n=1 Tax=Ideonella lacteola TaxID=2984193 RepID=A0ABU9BSZ5_9BURK
MGYALSWLAVRGKLPEQVLADLNATPTGGEVDFARSRLGARRLRSGWYAVFAREQGHAWMDPDTLGLLSASADLLACTVDENRLMSSAELWRAGDLVWQVLHDGQQSHDHLKITGEPPAPFAALAIDHRRLQAAAGGGRATIDHLFQVPLKLAQRVTGFKHDEGDAGADVPWTELHDGPVRPVQAKPSVPWWKRW